MSGVVTIFWAAAGDEILALAQEAAREAGAVVVETAMAALPAGVTAALDQGAVIVVTAGGPDATQAFGLGVDEVLTAAHVSRRVLDTTIRAACARAESRLRRRVRPESALADVTQGLALLTAAIDQQLGPPLLAASDACLALRQEFDRLVVTADRLQQWAALVAPTVEMEAVARMRAQYPSNSVHQKLHDVRVSLVRAETLIGLLRDVSTAETRGGCVDVSSVVAQLRDLVWPHVGAWASLHVYSEGECIAQVPRPVFVCIIAALIGRAVTAIRTSGRVPGEIEIRSSEKSDYENTVLVEIFDSGDPEMTFGPEVGRAQERAMADALLENIRDHARQFGGELLVQSDVSGTSIRLLMPTPGADAASERRPGETARRLAEYRR